MESEGRQMKQCWIMCNKERKKKKNPNPMFWHALWKWKKSAFLPQASGHPSHCPLQGMKKCEVTFAFSEKSLRDYQEACWDDVEGMGPRNHGVENCFHSGICRGKIGRMKILERVCQFHGRKCFWKLAIYSLSCFRYTVNGIGGQIPASLRP
jgi:hypothetical protein